MIKRLNKYQSALILTSVIFLQSCNSNVVFTNFVTIPEKTWDLMNIASYKVPVTDTINSNNIFFTIRTGSSYPYRNIYLFVSTTAPDGKILTDTLEYYLADEKGKWIGRGFGDIHELDLPYKSNVYFPLKGTYRFNIQHGMRIEDLKGVYDFGLTIEKRGK